MSFADLLAAGDGLVRDVLGESVTYTPTVGAAATVSGVFDAEYVRVEAGIAGVSSSGPAVFLAVDALPSDPTTDLTATVTVGGVTYSIFESKPDGLGGVVLILKRT